MDDGRAAASGEGPRTSGKKRGGAGREHRVAGCGSRVAGPPTPRPTTHDPRPGGGGGMPTLTFHQLAEMVGGTVVQNGGAVFSSVVIDSREVKPDSVFFAIKGERLDGHQFVTQALQTARGAVVSRVDFETDKAVVRVGDTTAALQRLARAIRERYDFLLI